MRHVRSKSALLSAQVSLYPILICAVAGLSMVNIAASQTTATQEKSSKTDSESSKSKATDKVLRHAVFFKFKDAATAKDVDGVVEAFRELPSKLDVIKDFQSGKNISQVGMDDGFTHCFLLTFKDEAGREVYLPHADHKAFGAMLRPHLDKVFVIDYWGKPQQKPKGDQLTHTAFIKFNGIASAEDIRSTEEAFLALASEVDTIKSIEWGTNNSPEKHDDGFTHALAVTFDSEADLDKYLSHPAHETFVRGVAPLVEKVRIFDFMTKKVDAAAAK